MRTFFLLSALPGSGKSTWAKQYQDLHPETKIISSDGIRVKFFGARQNFSDEKRVWAEFLREILDYGKEENATVIADATNITNEFRKYYYDMAASYDKRVLVLFDIPFEICLKQNKMRNSDCIVDEKAMNELHSRWETPSEEILKLYDEVIVIGPDFISPNLK
ncbi:MAG: ATP-binding protein [Bacilli bacterium]|nr:ATP-binding protein [Bacilli bacterium]